MTLVGPGGIGKTRVALELVNRQQHAFADGTWFVDLQAVQSPEHLVPAIAAVVGCPLANASDARTHLRTYLHTWHALLVLDNLEHLPGSSDLLLDLLATAPNLTLLVTTREVLNLACPLPQHSQVVHQPDLQQARRA